MFKNLNKNIIHFSKKSRALKHSDLIYLPNWLAKLNSKWFGQVLNSAKHNKYAFKRITPQRKINSTLKLKSMTE